MLRLIAALACLVIASAPALAKTVTIQPGDSLSAIAQRELGDGARWPEICEANRAALGDNCDHLLVGAKIEIPGASEMPAGQAMSETPAKAPEPAMPEQENIRLSGDLVLLAPEEAEFKTDSAALHVDPSPAGGLLLSGNDPEAKSGGRTGGIFVELPAEFEQKVSGKSVRVDVLVSAASGNGDFKMAYSTADVGNSGWQTLKAPQGHFDVASITYDVPAIKNGNGDFIGLLPDPDGAGNTLAIRAISVTILN